MKDKKHVNIKDISKQYDSIVKGNNNMTKYTIKKKEVEPWVNSD